MDYQNMDLPEAPWLSNVTFTADPCSLCDRQFKHHTRSRTAIEMRLVNHDQRTLQCGGNRERKFCILVMFASNKLRAEHPSLVSFRFTCISFILVVNPTSASRQP